MNILTVDNITKSYGVRKIFDGASFFLQEGEKDAALGSVEHAAAVQGLLSPGGVTGVGQIPDFYVEGYRILICILRDV